MRVDGDAVGGWVRAPWRGRSHGTDRGELRSRIATLSGDARRLLLLAAAEPLGDPLLLWSAAEQLGIGAAAAGGAEGTGCSRSVSGWRSGIPCSDPPCTDQRRCRNARRSIGRWRRRPIGRPIRTAGRGIWRRPRRDLMRTSRRARALGRPRTGTRRSGRCGGVSRARGRADRRLGAAG